MRKSNAPQPKKSIPIVIVQTPSAAEFSVPNCEDGIAIPFELAPKPLSGSSSGASAQAPLSAAVAKGLGTVAGLSNETQQPEDPKPKKRKRERDEDRRKAEIQKQEEIDALEDARAKQQIPTSPQEFRLLLLSSPNCSFLWCQFMAYWLVRNEVEKARQVAELALKSINVRESQELFNVWTAYLNLENRHGTTESFQSVLNRAVQHNDDQLKVYQGAVEILLATGKTMKVSPLYKVMAQKFPQNVEMWASYYKYCMEFESQPAMLKTMTKRALNLLPQDKHVLMMTKFGAIEMRHGNPDRGRAIFDGLVERYPKRTDVWSVYVDMEMVIQRERNLGDNRARVRKLFETITSLQLSSKSMQTFLTRYMAFEKEFGDVETQQAVHKRAVEYVERKCAQ